MIRDNYFTADERTLLALYLEDTKAQTEEKHGDGRQKIPPCVGAERRLHSLPTPREETGLVPYSGAARHAAFMACLHRLTSTPARSSTPGFAKTLPRPGGKNRRSRGTDAFQNPTETVPIPIVLARCDTGRSRICRFHPDFAMKNPGAGYCRRRRRDGFRPIGKHRCDGAVKRGGERPCGRLQFPPICGTLSVTVLFGAKRHRMEKTEVPSCRLSIARRAFACFYLFSF